jgi:hypothetical protein
VAVDDLEAFRLRLTADRRAGLSFYEAWSRAPAEVPVADWTTRNALDCMVEVWRRAYEFTSPPPAARLRARALLRLGDRDRDDDADIEPRSNGASSLPASATGAGPR